MPSNEVIGEPAGPIAPTASRLLPLLVIAPIAGLAVRWGRPHYLETDVASAVLTLLCAVVFGLPALFWALDNGRTRLAHLFALGFVAGLLSPLAVLAAGILGQFTYGSAAYVRRALSWGAPMPWYGLLSWRQFAGLVVASAVAGVVSAAVYWLLIVGGKRSLAVAFLLSIVVVAAGAMIASRLP
jgi:hypothetical protein